MGWAWHATLSYLFFKWNRNVWKGKLAPYKEQVYARNYHASAKIGLFFFAHVFVWLGILPKSHLFATH